MDVIATIYTCITRFTLSFPDYHAMAVTGVEAVIIETRTWDVIHTHSMSKAIFRHYMENAE